MGKYLVFCTLALLYVSALADDVVVLTEGGIKVHGDPYSPSTMRVVAALYEKELEFEFVPVDLGTGEHKKEHFLLLNPFGQVPAFEDGDLKLFESRAITQHIAHEYADKGTQLLCPGSKKDAAALLVGMEVEIHQYDAEASKLVREQIVKPLMGGTTDPAVVEEHEAKLAKVLDVYEARLTQFKYLASDSFTLVDLHHLPTVQYLSWTPTKKLFDSRPHVSAWVSDITSRPAWAKVIALQKK